MNETDRLKLKEYIHYEIDVLAQRIAVMESLGGPDKDDKEIRSEAMVMGELDKQALANAWKRMNILQQTIERIDDKSYGVCTVCGTNIPVERLMVVPEAQYCVKHAEDE